MTDRVGAIRNPQVVPRTEHPPEPPTPQVVRSLNPLAYGAEWLARAHLGEWARIAGTVTQHGRERYIVEWENGDQDLWPVDDPTGSHETR